MLNEGLKLDAALGSFWREDEARNTVLVIGGDPERRALGKTLLHAELRYFKVIEMASSDEAVALISANTKDRVALIVTFDSVDQGNESLRNRLLTVDPETHNIPKILVVDSDGLDPVPDDEALKARGIDEVVTLPLKVQDFRDGFMEALAKRSGAFAETENAVKTEVLKEFCEYNMALVEAWKKNITGMKYFELARGGKAGSSGEFILDMERDLDPTIKILSDLQIVIERGEVKIEFLRKCMHDLNNKLNTLVAFPSFIKEDSDIDPGDFALLTVIENEAGQMANHVSMISNAYHGRSSWKKVLISKPTMQKTGKLEIPKDTAFCVIDDDAAVLKVTKKIIETAGGSAILVDGKKALMELLESGEQAGKPTIQVFLLDHNLGNGVFGHELVLMIREHYPSALIIAHTSDAPTLNDDPSNPYRELGIEIVMKRAWNAVSGVLKNKLFRRPGSGVSRL